jgi:glycosyltransferase involved in cell wall biosynthesis
MACGLPVISSNVGEAHEFLDNNRGIILKEETPDELVEKIDYLLQHKTIAKQMGKKARTFIVKNYSWDEVAEKTENLYKTVIAERQLL